MTEADVIGRYREMRGEATRCLKNLRVFCGRDPVISGLNGWVFEQTVHRCIRESLASCGAALSIEEQFPLGGRIRADLRVERIAIEIKAAGLFGQRDIAKYRRCQSAARARGMRFAFLSLYESHKPYRTQITDALGADNVFFLTDGGSWQRFMDLLLSGPEESPT